MDTSKLGRCLYCHRPLLTSFVYLQAVRGLDLVLPAHVGCVELVQGGLTGSDLVDAKAKRDAILDGVETLFLGAPVVVAGTLRSLTGGGIAGNITGST